MPLYEYQCSKCQKVHEIMQKFSDSPLTDCPDCGAQVTKLMSATSFMLKGSGWYTTDYKRKHSGGTPAESGNAASGSAASAPVANPSAPATPSSGGASGATCSATGGTSAGST